MKRDGADVLRVVAFARTDAVGPSSRYRYYQYRERLARLGVELRIAPLFGRTWFRLRRLPLPLKLLLAPPYVLVRYFARLQQAHALGASPPDLIVVEHQLLPYLPPFLERGLRRFAPWVLEFDDAIHLTRFHGKKLAELCRLADAVVVGNEELADFARGHARHVEIVPTTIDLEAKGPPRERSARDADPHRPFVVAWIGLPYNFPSLRLLAAPLARLAKRRPIRLRVISSGAPDLPGVPVEALEWDERREAAWLREADAGIMPLQDDAWSRGKCGLKILQYFAAGLPVVASPVGVNEGLIRDGENGLLARSPADFEHQLFRLAEDPELAARLGRAGRRTVEAFHSATPWAARLAGLWRAIAETRGKRR